MKNPVDVLIAQRLRTRRLMLGMTQAQLADAVGIRFQQIQKYETGLNRVSAARLWGLSRALDTNVATFFAGSVEDSVCQDEPLQQEVIELVRAYLAMTDIPRRRLRDLARAMNTTTNKLSSRYGT